MLDCFKKIPAICPGYGPITGFDRKRGFQYIWFGTLDSPDRPPVRWRVLSEKGNGEGYRIREGDELNGGGMLLLSDSVLGTHPLSGEIRRNHLIKFYDEADEWKKLYLKDGELCLENPSLIWQNSSARKWCRHFEEACFSKAEGSLLLSTFKSDREYRSKRGTYPPTIIAAAEGILDGDRIFFLSAEEAENNEYGFKDKKVYTAEQEWWTRSFERYTNYGDSFQYLDVCIVLTHFGGLLPCPATTKMYTRPAFNQYKDRIMLVSAAVGGKERTLPQGSAILKKVPALSPRKLRDWKLTILDSGRDGFSAAVEKKEGSLLTLSYRGAAVYDPEKSPDERVSAIVTDKAQTEIKFYGNIALPLSPDGQAQLDLAPLKLREGDCILVFSEQCNGDKRTDYTSKLVKLRS